jgi:hypothetical protein
MGFPRKNTMSKNAPSMRKPPGKAVADPWGDGIMSWGFPIGSAMTSSHFHHMSSLLILHWNSYGITNG